MKFSVCLEAVYAGRDMISAMKDVKALGYDAVECWLGWNRDIEAFSQARQEWDLQIAAICTPMISLVDAGCRRAYLDGLRGTVAAARRLACPTIISQVGDELAHLSRAEQHKSLVAGLQEAAPLLESEGLTLVIEPLNTTVDHKGYYLWQSDEAADIVGELGSPHVKMLFDIYHQQIMEGNIIERCVKNIGVIGHMHAAGVPGRHELDTGELNYAAIFAALDAAGYAGYMGLEYFPLRSPQEGLSTWVSQP